MKLFSRQFHALIDYPVALSLVVLPFVLDLGAAGPLALWLSVVTGVAALLLTVLTDHETGLVPLLPYPVHLAVDGLVGAAFVAVPFVLGLSGLAAAYYWAVGVAVLLVVAAHRPAEAGATA